LLAALAGCSCGRAPTAPAVTAVNGVSLTPPAEPEIGPRYLFTVTPSSSCATVSQGSLFARTFEFELVREFATGSFLVQPVRRQIDGPNSGSVTLLVLGGNPPGTGMLTGTGLAADGVSIVGFGLGATPTVEGYSFLFPATGAPPNEMTGDIQGSIWVSASSSAAATVCFGANHKYKLTPKS